MTGIVLKRERDIVNSFTLLNEGYTKREDRNSSVELGERTEYKYTAVPWHVCAERRPPCVIGTDAPFARVYRGNSTLALGLWREETTSGKTEKRRERRKKKKKGKEKKKAE